MYYFDGHGNEHDTSFKAHNIKDLKRMIEKSSCQTGEIYRGNTLYAKARKVRNYDISCGSWNEWSYETCKF